MDSSVKGRTITALQLNLAVGHVFLTKRSLMNKELSNDADFAEPSKISIRSLDNDMQNKRVIINKGKGDEQSLSYDFELSINEEDAKRAAAYYNRTQIEKIQSVIDKKMEEIETLEKLQNGYKQLKEVGLI